MQPLARDGRTADEVKAAILAANESVPWGVDLLDLNDQQIGDISDRVTECTVTWNGYADVHRGIDMTIVDDLDWPNVRVRPWQEVGGARFYSGVFGLQIPQTAAQTGMYQVLGGDKLTILQRLIGDTYWAAKSTPSMPTFYLSVARQAIVDSGLTGTPSQIQSDADAVELVDDLVWALDLQSPASYARVVNDSIAQVNYRALWMTAEGAPRSIPYRRPVERPAEWDFVVGGPDPNAVRSEIVLPDRTVMLSNWARPSAWRFTRNGMDTQPVEDAGLYTVGDWDDPAAVRAVYGMDAASQDALVSRGDQQVIVDTSRTRLITFETPPMPQLDHFDISNYTDADLAVSAKVQHRSWSQVYHQLKVQHTVEVVDDGLA